MKDKLYLDTINGAPLRPTVAEAIGQACDLWGNPASLHSKGGASASALDQARSNVAGLIQAKPEEIYFTSGGTEANAWALTGLAKASVQGRKQIIISAVEHLSVIHTTRLLEKQGFEVVQVPVNAQGIVNLEALEQVITEATAVVSVQWANSEVGTIQPMAEIVALAKPKGALVHTDAVAAVGQISVDVQAIPVDALSLAGAPLGGPAGVGALYVRKGTRIQPLLVGGTQEDGRRAGSENMVGIVGLGVACTEIKADLENRQAEVAASRKALRADLAENVPGIQFNGASENRLPGHLSLSFEGEDAEALVCALEMQSIQVGIGSACTTMSIKASHVLKAMGLSDSQALGTVTISFVEPLKKEEQARIVSAFQSILQKETIGT